jgi:hypothetical protein
MLDIYLSNPVMPSWFNTVLHASVVVQSMRKITIGLGGMQKLCFCLFIIRNKLHIYHRFIADSCHVLISLFFMNKRKVILSQEIKTVPWSQIIS